MVMNLVDFDRIVIRPAKVSDAAEISKIRNNGQVLFNLNDCTMYSEHQCFEWIKSREGCLFVFDVDGCVLGWFHISRVDAINKSCCFTIVVNPDESGKGLGKYIMIQMLDYLFKYRGFHSVYLEVLSTNFAAIKLYESLGFCFVGCRRQGVFRSGEYCNVFLYDILAHEWFHRKE